MGTIYLIGPNDLVGPIDLICQNDLVGLIDLIGPNDLVGTIGSSLFVVPEYLSQRFDVPSFCKDPDFWLYLIGPSNAVFFIFCVTILCSDSMFRVQ